MIYITGHKNPDADSISSAIVLADFLTQQGKQAVPCKQGPVNYESQYILDLVGYQAPQDLGDLTGCDLWLVDHSDLLQAPDDLAAANLLGIVDHHRLGDITTVNQLEMWVRPVGCTSTVLYEMYKSQGFAIKKDIATLMTCAILSDTVGFLSPTTTQFDKDAVHALAQIAEIADLDSFIKNLLIAKTNIVGLSTVELIQKDLKAYNFKDGKLVVGQLELASMDQVSDSIDALNAELKRMAEEDDMSLAALMLTDITTKTTVLLYQGPWSSKLDPFKKDDKLIMENTLSRKKQGWPWLQENL